MKRTILICMLTLVSVATWARNASSSNLITVSLWIIGFAFLFAILSFIFHQLSRNRRQVSDILEMPQILRRIIAKIETEIREYFEIIHKKDDYPQWVLDKIHTISTELDNDCFFQNVDNLVSQTQSETVFEEQKIIYKHLLNAETRIRSVMHAIHAIIVQNRMYQIEAPIAIQSVADHLKDLRSENVDISLYSLRLQELADLLQSDDKLSKKVFDTCKQLLKETNAQEDELI